MCKITPWLTPPSHSTPHSFVCPFILPMAPTQNSTTLWLGIGIAGSGGPGFCFGLFFFFNWNRCICSSGWLRTPVSYKRGKNIHGGLIINHKWSVTEERNSQERLFNITTLILFLSQKAPEEPWAAWWSFRHTTHCTCVLFGKVKHLFYHFLKVILIFNGKWQRGSVKKYNMALLLVKTLFILVHIKKMTFLYI